MKTVVTDSQHISVSFLFGLVATVNYANSHNASFMMILHKYWFYYLNNTHTHTIILRLFWILSGTPRVSQYQKGKSRKVKPISIYWSKI